MLLCAFPGELFDEFDSGTICPQSLIVAALGLSYAARKLDGFADHSDRSSLMIESGNRGCDCRSRQRTGLVQ